MPQMPQNFIARSPTNTSVPLQTNARGALQVSGQNATSTALNITTATLVKAGAGQAVRIVVTAAGTTPGMVNDAATIGAVAAANQIAAVPNVVGATTLEFPFFAGLVVTPGAGQTVSVAFA